MLYLRAKTVSRFKPAAAGLTGGAGWGTGEQNIAGLDREEFTYYADYAELFIDLVSISQVEASMILFRSITQTAPDKIAHSHS